VLRKKLKSIREIGEIETRNIITTISKNGKGNLRKNMDTVINKFENRDCMEGMKEYPDGYFDLAVVDPPYGIGFSDYERCSSGVLVKERYTKSGKKKWDSNVPKDDYFKELLRVSKNQIVWGGNYFAALWGAGCKSYIFWYKQNPVPNFADGELAWTSFDMPAKCFNYMYCGNINSEKDRSHPTQKPVALYLWLLNNYAKQGDLILDTHVGSASSLIACEKMGFNYVGYELDPDYYRDAQKRLSEFRLQIDLFDEPKEEIKPDQFRLNL